MTQAAKIFGILILLTAVLIGTAVTRNVFADEGHHEGLLMNLNSRQIEILNRSHSATNVFPLAPFVQVTRNGQRSDLRALRRGDAVQILTETRFQQEIVVTVNAVSDD